MLLRALDAVAAVVVGLAVAVCWWMLGHGDDAVCLVDEAMHHAAVRLGLSDDDDT